MAPLVSRNFGIGVKPPAPEAPQKPRSIHHPRKRCSARLALQPAAEGGSSTATRAYAARPM